MIIVNLTKTSGLLFEKKLIEKYLTEEGNKCPVTGKDLFPEDLLPVQGSFYIHRKFGC